MIIKILKSPFITSDWCRETAVKVLLIPLFVILSLLSGCDVSLPSLPVTSAEMVGTYEANFDVMGSETIILFADSTYRHTYKPLGKKSHVQTGNWRLVKVEVLGPNRYRLDFEGFQEWYPIDVHGHGAFKGYRQVLDTLPHGWLPYINKHPDGSIFLVKEPSYHQYYVKVKE